MDLRSLLGLGGKVKREETFCQHLMACKEPEAFLVEDARQHWRWDCRFAVQINGQQLPCRGVCHDHRVPASTWFGQEAARVQHQQEGVITLLHTKGGTEFQRLTSAACPQGCTADWGGHAWTHPAISCWAASTAMETRIPESGTRFLESLGVPAFLRQNRTLGLPGCVWLVRGATAMQGAAAFQPCATLLKTIALQIPSAPRREGRLVRLLCGSAAGGPQWGAAWGPVPPGHPAAHLQRPRLPPTVHAGRAGCQGGGAGVAGRPPGEPAM